MRTATLNPSRGVLVAPPDPLAGVGEALRQAFLIDAATRSLHAFGDLLARLERHGPPAGDGRGSSRPR